MLRNEAGVHTGIDDVGLAQQGPQDTDGGSHTGTLTTYRSPGGAGVRLDGATAVGAEISPNFDSLLVMPG